MDNKVQEQLYGLCNSIECLLRMHLKDEVSFFRQKLLIDLFSAVLSYQLIYKGEINGTETI